MQLLLLFIIILIIVTTTAPMLMLTVLTATYNQLMTDRINNAQSGESGGRISARRRKYVGQFEFPS